MKITIFPGKYHQNGGFSMAMLVSGRVYMVLFDDGESFLGCLFVCEVCICEKRVADVLSRTFFGTTA